MLGFYCKLFLAMESIAIESLVMERIFVDLFADDTYLMGYLIQLVPIHKCNPSMVNLELEIPYVSIMKWTLI